MTLPEIISAEIFLFLLVFTRVGTIMMLMPLIGENYIPTWIRLGFAFTFSVVLTPVVGSAYVQEPSSFAALLMVLGGEFFIGLFLGLFMRILLSTLTTAGILISFISGFSAALMFNPLLQSQGVLHSALMTLSGFMFLFALDLHHLFFIAIADSYILLPDISNNGDMAETIAKAVSASFAMALKLTAPIMAVTILFYSVLGIASRLMPQLHIFFIGLPVQIALGMFSLSIIFLTMMLFYAEYFVETMESILL